MLPYRSRALFVGLALAGFALTSALLGVFLPDPDMGEVSDKLAWLEEHLDEVDVVFFGSSRVYRGVVPEVFDRELARRGHRVRSFNFGVAGMGAHESSALVRRVLRMKPARLRWVVVELDGWNAALRPENRFKRRMVAWHDPVETALVLRTVALSGGSRTERLQLAWAHVLHLGAHLTGAGHGRSLIEELRRDDPTWRLPPADAESRGFAPYSEGAYDTPSSHPFRRRFLSMIPVYEQAVARLGEANRAKVTLDNYNVQAVASQVAAIRRSGARLIHLITPTARPTPELYRLASVGGVQRLIAFNDPERYPELFAVENRFDAEHLTTAGAERFSRLLAARFVRLLEEDGEGLPSTDLRIAGRR